MLVIAEDAQWLDRSTADVLAFVARRLEYQPIVLLAAIREGFDSPLEQVGLPALNLEPLDPEAASALLDASAPDASPDVRQRVLDEAAGNPLALVELPASFKQLDGRARPPAWLPLTTRLARAFAARLHDLPPTTRTALLVGRSDSTSLSEVLAASGLLIAPSCRSTRWFRPCPHSSPSSTTPPRSPSATPRCVRRSRSRRASRSVTPRTPRSPACSPSSHSGGYGIAQRR